MTGSLLATPLAARAQQAGKVARVGVITGSPGSIAALKEGLADLGHLEGQSFVIDHRDVEARFERLQAAVASLVKVPVDVIVIGGSEYVQSVMNATRIIPVVFTNVGDPVGLGYITSYAKPGRECAWIECKETESRDSVCRLRLASPRPHSDHARPRRSHPKGT